LPEKGLQHGVFRTIIEENVGKGEHMEIKRAAELLRGLADGVDPMTGRPLPDESVYNRPEIIRALHCVLRALQERADRHKRGPKLERGGGSAAASGIRCGAHDRDDRAPPWAEHRRHRNAPVRAWPA